MPDYTVFENSARDFRILYLHHRWSGATVGRAGGLKEPLEVFGSIDFTRFRRKILRQRMLMGYSHSRAVTVEPQFLQLHINVRP
jgi:hypothetical protein